MRWLNYILVFKSWLVLLAPVLLSLVVAWTRQFAETAEEGHRVPCGVIHLLSAYSQLLAIWRTSWKWSAMKSQWAKLGKGHTNQRSKNEILNLPDGNLFQIRNVGPIYQCREKNCPNRFLSYLLRCYETGLELNRFLKNSQAIYLNSLPSICTTKAWM